MSCGHLDVGWPTGSVNHWVGLSAIPIKHYLLLTVFGRHDDEKLGVVQLLFVVLVHHFRDHRCVVVINGVLAHWDVLYCDRTLFQAFLQ